MDDPRGGVCSEQEHWVKTFEKAKEWFPYVEERDLPIKIVQYKSSDGRTRLQVYNHRGLIYHKG